MKSQQSTEMCSNIEEPYFKQNAQNILEKYVGLNWCQGDMVPTLKCLGIFAWFEEKRKAKHCLKARDGVEVYWEFTVTNQSNKQRSKYIWLSIIYWKEKTDRENQFVPQGPGFRYRLQIVDKFLTLSTHFYDQTRSTFILVFE